MTNLDLTLFFAHRLLVVQERAFEKYCKRVNQKNWTQKSPEVAKVIASRAQSKFKASGGKNKSAGLRRQEQKVYRRWHYDQNREKYIANAIAHQRIRRPIRHAEDPAYRLTVTLRNRVKSALRGNSKAAGTLELLGCSAEKAWKHIESQLQPGWTKVNYGTVWEIDHIRPCASFDLSDPEQQRECFNWKNLQPLSVTDNRRKNKRWEGK